jgi:hypothetical protein
MHQVPCSFDPQTLISRLSSWLENCRANHQQCVTTLSGSSIDEVVDASLPTRVLDLGKSDSSNYVRLFETNGSHGQYCALSHCWGPQDRLPPRTIKSTLNNHIQGIEISSLPKTFQDAIAVTRGLGIRYLWIDSLCIVQDDEKDWESEAKQMGKVYQAALLVIAASGAANCHVGCFIAKSRELLSEEVPYFSSLHDIAPSGKFFFHQIFDTSPDWGPLQKRGWSFQEWRLARRIVHFTEGGMEWQCRERAHAHLGEVVQPEQLRWDELLWTYCEAAFTFETDRLIALQGLASELQVGRQDRYCYGMWTADFPLQLLWMRLGPGLTDGLTDVPSWSWASKLGPRLFWSMISNEVHLGIESQAISVDATGTMMMYNTLLRKCSISHPVLHLGPNNHLPAVQDFFGDPLVFVNSGDKGVDTGTLSEHNCGLAILDAKGSGSSAELYCLFIAKTEIGAFNARIIQMIVRQKRKPARNLNH